MSLYTPPAFRWSTEEGLAFAGERNFATLVTAAETLFVSHAPTLVDRDRGVVRAHLARANPHAAHLAERRCTAIYLGPHAYVSPDWYESGSHDVPTWNYVAIHIEGVVRILADDAAIDRLLADLSAHEETRRCDLREGRREWTIDKLGPEQLTRMRSAIVAFEIEIEKVEAKAKLSQNKGIAAAEGVAAALARTGSERSQELAALMRAVNERRI